MDVITSYIQGCTKLSEGNKPGALQFFQSAFAQQPSHFDLLRGCLACVREQYTLEAGDMEPLFERVDTFGYVANDADVSPAYPPMVYPIGWMNLRRVITSKHRFFTTYAMHLAVQGEFQRASEVLERMQREIENGVIPRSATDNPEAQLAYAVLYALSERWPQALQEATKLQNALAYDPYTETVIVEQDDAMFDIELQAAGYLIAGKSQAYLGNASVAKQLLSAVVAPENPDIYTKAEAYRLLALIARGEGNSEDAEKLLASGLALAPTDALLETQKNSLQRINVTSPEMIEERTQYWDVSTQPSLQDREAQKADSYLQEVLEEAERELAKQIGMEGVKDQVRKLQTRVRYNQAMQQRGKTVHTSTNHLILTGPPGTGKTTIARVIAKIYAGYGLITDPDVVETSRSDFVAQYEGQTAPKTRETFEKARGKVLFIDEAYDMVQDRDGRADSFGQEAVNELLQQMENHRDDTIVIIAGYEGDIKRFLATNDGLNSRFATWIKFESYSAEELAQIARVIAQSRDNIFTDEAFQAVVDAAAGLQSQDHNGVKLVDKLGNGRFARNVVENAETQRLERFMQVDDMSQLSDEELTTLTGEDVAAAVKEVTKSVL